MKRMLIRLLVAMAIVGAGAELASAQSLAGTVRDTSGAVLPGVTVEASSPALITKVRTGVTDDTGQYRIPDLPPGTYKISFTLAGFATVVREGVELTGGGVMTIGAEMRVGASRSPSPSPASRRSWTSRRRASRRSSTETSCARFQRREATATTSRPFRRFKPPASAAARRPSTTSSRRAAGGVPKASSSSTG